jgi:hypothetical protein
VLIIYLAVIFFLVASSYLSILLDSPIPFLASIPVTLGLIVLSALRNNAQIKEITDEKISISCGIRRTTIREIRFHEIDDIVVKYALGRAGYVMHLTIRTKATSNRPKGGIIKFYLNNWSKMPGENWVHMTLNELSKRCDVYVKGWWFWMKRHKWKPVDVWIPFEERNKDKH